MNHRLRNLLIVVAGVGFFWLAGKTDDSGPRYTPPAGSASTASRSSQNADWRIDAAAQTAVRARLIDPDSAQFRNITVHGGVACGEVNSKNAFGGYTGFKQFLSNGQGITFLASDTEPAEFQKAWTDLCK